MTRLYDAIYDAAVWITRKLDRFDCWIYKRFPLFIAEWVRAATYVAGITVVAVVLAILLGGCSSIPMTKAPDKDVIWVKVEWSSPEKIAAECGFSRDGVIACFKDGYRIIMRMINGWNDESGICTLGHEVFHALGAEHK